MTITLRSVKGLPLTNAELDDNFATLDTRGVQIAGDIGGSTSAPYVVSLGGRALSSSAPAVGQTLVWSGSVWTPSTTGGSGGSGGGSSTVTSTVTPTISSTTTTYPAFSAYPSSSVQQTITSGSQQKVLFQNEEFDIGNSFSSSKFQPTVAGYYQLNSVVRISGTMGTGENMLVIWKNGNEWKRGWNQSGTEVGANFLALQVSALVYANGTTDYFEIYIQQGSGSNRDITVAHQAGGWGNITWFNGVYVPTQVITAITSTATVTSVLVSGGGQPTVADKINSQFNGLNQVFTLKVNRTAIIEGYNYKDNKDLLVTINGRVLDPYVTQNTLGPWIVDMKAESAYTYKVSGSKLILFRAPRAEETATIRLNTVSSARQTTSRYPFTANTIAFGD
jgi:hypothetical protein